MIWSVSVRHFKKLYRWKLEIWISLSWKIYFWYAAFCCTQNRSKRIWACERITTFHYRRDILKNRLYFLRIRTDWRVFWRQFKGANLIFTKIFSQALYCFYGIFGTFRIQKSTCTSWMRFWNLEQLISLWILGKR